MGVPTIVLARTDAEAANLTDPLTTTKTTKPFLTGERTQEGFYRVKNGFGTIHQPWCCFTRHMLTWYGVKQVYLDILHVNSPSRIEKTG